MFINYYITHNKLNDAELMMMMMTGYVHVAVTGMDSKCQRNSWAS